MTGDHDERRERPERPYDPADKFVGTFDPTVSRFIAREFDAQSRKERDVARREGRDAQGRTRDDARPARGTVENHGDEPASDAG